MLPSDVAQSSKPVSCSESCGWQVRFLCSTNEDWHRVGAQKFSGGLGASRKTPDDAPEKETPRQRWERLHGGFGFSAPTGIALVEWLVERARWQVAEALVSQARGVPVHDECFDELDAIVADLKELVRERRVA